MQDQANLLVFSGNANRPLAQAVCDELGIRMGKALVGRFSDGEVQVEIEENVRGQDVFVIQPTCAPSAENLMELLVLIDALRRASANRVTAVVLDDLDASCVAAVSRLVLVGRGGLRLHEEVFVTGIRLKAQDLAEEKVLGLLDRALDAGDHESPGAGVRAYLADAWNAEGSRMRERLTAAMERRAGTRQARVQALLAARRQADETRAREIFAAFRVNLTDSIHRLEHDEEEQLAMLFGDDQREQRRKDLRNLRSRLDSLADEERRELDAIRQRYTDVKPYVSAAAVVFALTAADVAAWGAGR